MTLVLVMILVMVMILTANPRDALVAMGEEAGKTCKQVQRVLFTNEQVGDDGKAHKSSQWALKNYISLQTINLKCLLLGGKMAFNRTTGRSVNWSLHKYRRN